MSNKLIIGRILLCAAIILAAYSFTGNLNKGLALAGMVICVCVWIRGD